MKRTWDGVGIELEETLYLGEVKTPEAPHGTWVGMGMEVFKALYP
jgi:hypothetical protein